MKFSLYLWAMSFLAALLVKDLMFQMEHVKIAQQDILKWCNGIILSTMRAVQGALIVASCIQIILGFSQIWAICSRFFSRLGYTYYSDSESFVLGWELGRNWNSHANTVYSLISGSCDCMGQGNNKTNPIQNQKKHMQYGYESGLGNF
ncbi:uncharacterized protein LOC107458062 isoform X1 [Arachis duranensis]|uniref:Uncharacterized protein LOC107458062 isoform X1 n=1 Tax=Arachis duranensis TaxID=130453 RepID=A0A6P4BK33_ARADU|nr:uncharacterized protein LOC107458062 isoform X1 [Arachis duranensis]XP_052107685.1 uncharacterized protein LOC107458062 isoform X1 [Arachis duranensis]